LSPKKTWEGFAGGAIMTLLYGFLLSRILSNFDLMICGKKDFSMAYPHCVPSQPFLVAAQYDLPSPIVAALEAIAAVPALNIITTALTYVSDILFDYAITLVHSLLLC
jgi:CDP-diglyceride synthetase